MAKRSQTQVCLISVLPGARQAWAGRRAWAQMLPLLLSALVALGKSPKLRIHVYPMRLILPVSQGCCQNEPRSPTPPTETPVTEWTF